MAEFQFKPGDYVALAAEIDRIVPPAKWTIIERLTQECIGGIQRHYDLRTYRRNEDGSTTACAMRVLDFEVAAYPTEADMTKAEEAIWMRNAAKAARRKELGVPTRLSDWA